VPLAGSPRKAVALQQMDQGSEDCSSDLGTLAHPVEWASPEAASGEDRTTL
jgi:hypothetical protein